MDGSPGPATERISWILIVVEGTLGSRPPFRLPICAYMALFMVYKINMPLCATLSPPSYLTKHFPVPYPLSLVSIIKVSFHHVADRSSHGLLPNSLCEAHCLLRRLALASSALLSKFSCAATLSASTFRINANIPSKSKLSTIRFAAAASSSMERRRSC